MVRLTAVGFAVAIGVGLGIGLWLLASLLPRLGGPDLAARVAPYVADLSAEARAVASRRPADLGPVLGALLPALRRGAHRMLARALGGDALVELRIRQAGGITSVGRMRSQQLLGAAIGAVGGITVAVVVLRTAAAPAIVGMAAVPVLALAGVVVPDRMLTRAASRRLRRMTDELPTVLEFLVLSLAAGEGLLDALRRVARAGSGELAGELRAVVAGVNAGRPLATALEDSSAALALPAWTRCVEQLTAALDRGTPVADVLRAQAQDSRDQAARALIEAAGRKEVTMLVPLVFLILPVTVLYAIFPGILVLQLGF